MYEGRTRGKKLKYTYSDEEDMFSDDVPSRRSTRNAGSTTAAAEPSRPRFTASGRQIRSRAGGMYGEALLTGQREDSEYDEEEEEGRPQRTRSSRHPNGYSGYRIDDLEDESEAVPSDANDSGNEWNGGEDDENEFEGDDEGEDVSGDESVVNGEPRSLVVQLRYGKGNGPQESKVSVEEPPPTRDVQMNDAGHTGLSAGMLAPSQNTTLPTPADGRETDRLAETAQPAPTTSPSFPPVPPLQQHHQPPPSLVPPPMHSASDFQGAKLQPSTNGPVSESRLPSVSAASEALKSNQPAESNGLNGASSKTEKGAGPGLPQWQNTFTQG